MFQLNTTITCAIICLHGLSCVRDPLTDNVKQKHVSLPNISRHLMLIISLSLSNK